MCIRKAPIDSAMSAQVYRLVSGVSRRGRAGLFGGPVRASARTASGAPSIPHAGKKLKELRISADSRRCLLFF
jgi:hypothetical protein